MPLTAENIGQTDAVKTAGQDAVPAAAESSVIHVLAIDDNEEFRNLITELLRPLGFDVDAVASPVKALEKFTQEKDRFQLVLLDYYMPQLDGAKTFEWLKKLNPNVKVIIVSGAKNCGSARSSLNTRSMAISASRSASKKPFTSSTM